MKAKLTSLFLMNLCFIFSLASCSNTNTITFILSKEVNSGNAISFANQINKQLQKNNVHVDIKVQISNDEQTKINKIINDSADFAFLKANTLMINDSYKYLNASIQTLTNKFKFDINENDTYIDGSVTDPLISIANKTMSLSFDVKPFYEWNDNDFNWDINKYRDFYFDNEYISKYRGMVLFSGTETQINNAIDFWNKKQWNNFRNLGIITGKPDSFGLYKLQEKLFKKHFNNPNDTFTTLAEDKLKHPDKYTVDEYGLYKHGKFSNFVISFSEQGSFTWTQNIKNVTNFFKPRNDSKIKIFTVTDSFWYDIGVFSKKISSTLKYQITDAIIQVTKTDNSYGNGLGYNSYEKII